MTGSPGLALSPLYGPVVAYLSHGLPVPFAKPYRSAAENLDELRRRGLSIGDRAHAERCLARIGYYRLSAYWYPFRQFANEVGTMRRRDDFRAGASFDDVIRFYLFDKDLRLRLTDALERIEIAVRAQLVDALGRIDPLSYRDPRTYTASFTDTTDGGEPLINPFIRGLDESFKKSQEEFAKHFRTKNEGPPPIWIAAGTWDWGNLSYMIGYLSEKNRDAVCRAIDSRITRKSLASWMKCLNEVRNACAHHSRLWNKALINSPRLKPSEIDEFTALCDERGSIPDVRKKRLYGALVAASFLLRSFYPNTEWPARLGRFIAEADLPDEVGTSSAGFPVGWTQASVLA